MMSSLEMSQTKIRLDQPEMVGDEEDKPKLKKRKYSRGGCIECKRRKMKCDEAKPFCHNCTRLKKSCNYPPKQQFRFESISNNNNGVKNGSTTTTKPGINNNSFELRTYNPNPQSRATNPTDGSNSVISDVRSMSPAITVGLNESNIRGDKPSVVPPSPSSKTKQNGVSSNANAISNNKKMFKNAISDILANESISTPISMSPFDDKEMKNLFDEASLLVNDLNGLVSLDFFEMSAAPDVPGKPNKDVLRTTDKLEVEGIQLSAVHNRSETSSRSETFERLNFQIDEFSNKIKLNLSPIDVDSPLYFQEFMKSEHDFSISNSELISRTLKHYNLDGPHETYLNSLTHTDLCFHMFPFASSIESNEIIKILLKYSNNCPYLLTSLLAISATFQFNQSDKRVHELSFQKYITVCLQTLSDAFLDKNSKKYEVNDIEKLLLTVLVLASNFTATTNSGRNMYNNWKTHLRGAKDLLMNYLTVYQQKNKFNISGGLALAKTWFYAIESIAGLISPLGGTINSVVRNMKNDQEHVFSNENDNLLYSEIAYFNKEVNPGFHDALIRIGLLTNPPAGSKSCEFNLYLGYTIKLVDIIAELVKVMDLLRSEPNLQIDSTEIAKLFSLIDAAKDEEIVTGLNKNSFFIIPASSPGHPEYSIHSPDKIILPQSCYGSYTNSKGEKNYYSWFDLSQRLHLNALYLPLLTKKGLLNLPTSSPVVRELFDFILDSAFFIKSKLNDKDDYEMDKSIIVAETESYYLSKQTFDIRAIMVLVPFRICCRFAKSDDDFEKLEVYFIGLKKLGNGSAQSALDLLYKYKARAKSNGSDTVIHDEMGMIPFA
ncbi:hypothetical protein DFJ63DRAFT_317639 [Scheffersomyces coipomensis]|uniref:uncharacterized protein n=1 Tax=Scheffersomyces coipomensis TaxID=1788519 RepID=UPI00315CF727